MQKYIKGDTEWQRHCPTVQVPGIEKWRVHDCRSSDTVGGKDWLNLFPNRINDANAWFAADGNPEIFLQRHPPWHAI
jgi:hypothetical protein